MRLAVVADLLIFLGAIVFAWVLWTFVARTNVLRVDSRRYDDGGDAAAVSVRQLYHYVRRQAGITDDTSDDLFHVCFDASNERLLILRLHAATDRHSIRDNDYSAQALRAFHLDPDRYFSLYNNTHERIRRHLAANDDRVDSLQLEHLGVLWTAREYEFAARDTVRTATATATTTTTISSDANSATTRDFVAVRDKWARLRARVSNDGRTVEYYLSGAATDGSMKSLLRVQLPMHVRARPTAAPDNHPAVVELARESPCAIARARDSYTDKDDGTVVTVVTVPPRLYAPVLYGDYLVYYVRRYAPNAVLPPRDSSRYNESLRAFEWSCRERSDAQPELLLAPSNRVHGQTVT